MLLLIASCAVLWSLETLVPLRRHPRRVAHAVPNVALTIVVLLTNLTFSFAAARASRLGVIALPPLLGIVALDLSTYLAHVALHKSPLGWRFHRLHHSDEEVDVTTAFRQHPLESLWRIAAQLPAIALFGIPMWAVTLYLTISATNAQLEHANIRVPSALDRALRLLFVTPHMHKVHHSAWQPETDSNYANIFSVWDRLFGTYTGQAEVEGLRYGLG